MAMHQLPFRPFVLKDQGHPQRPVLVRHSADLAVLPLDRHEYGHVSRRICLHELQVRLPAPEHLRRGFQCLIDVEAAPWLPAVRRHEGVRLSVLDQREVSVNISSYIRGGGVRSSPDELGDVPVGNVSLPHFPVSSRFCRRMPRSRQQEAMKPGWRPCVRDMEVGLIGADTHQLAAQERSLSGLRTTQMCLIRSPATSNANTVTMRPSCWATRPGWPLTVRSVNAMVPDARLAISTQARAICSLPSMGSRKAVTRPPPSAMAVASGSSRPTRASMSLASQARLKARMMPACRAAGAAGACDARTRRRAEEASWRQAAGVRPTISATSAKG